MRPPGPLEVGLILVIILVIVVPGISILLFFILRQQKKKKEEQKDDRYLEIAKERYAKGEISHEQFEQIKKDLP